MDATTLSANFEAREKATAELRTLTDEFAGKEMTAEAREKEERLLSAVADFDGRIKRGVDALKANEGVQSLMSQLDSSQGSGLGQRSAEPVDDSARLREGDVTNEARSWEFRAGTKADNPNVLARSLYGQLLAQAVERSAIMRGGASTFTTADGNPIDFTIVTDRASASIVAEGGTVGESLPATAQRSMGAFKYGYASTVSYELATDQVLDLVGFLVGDAGPAIGDAMGRHFLTGSGTNQPRGILTDASDAVATFAPGDADSKVSDALIDLFYELSSPYRTNASFVVNDKVAAQMRKLKDANGQYLWQSALTAGAPDLFNGKSVQTDTAVPVDKVMFGDLSKYRVRFAGPLRVDRSTDIKFMNDQVVYRFLQRADGLLVDQNAAKVLTIAEAGGGA
ncbi:phage major capsid protein [Streptomyces sp. DHE17-7]|uniref:phage major capsid protein n=1 Tax=Streptomyces sp. DHE17-7 TaxID=2759949 RepID=UPI0022EACAFA|nr:phage major capsid protein [Streptomyces sp. DHE17-7]MBJ6623596.1 phage major capsid protein [Streptomyces sp. DHE17-7]